jgi:hypothetical protein
MCFPCIYIVTTHTKLPTKGMYKKNLLCKFNPNTDGSLRAVVFETKLLKNGINLLQCKQWKKQNVWDIRRVKQLQEAEYFGTKSAVKNAEIFTVRKNVEIQWSQEHSTIHDAPP